jgi:hypothetical protein
VTLTSGQAFPAGSAQAHVLPSQSGSAQSEQAAGGYVRLCVLGVEHRESTEQLRKGLGVTVLPIYLGEAPSPAQSDSWPQMPCGYSHICPAMALRK